MIAGICGGLSILAKITGAYFIAGVLLYFVFREQAISKEHSCEQTTRARFYSSMVTFLLALFVALLFVTIHKIPGTNVLVYFVLPAFGLVVLVLAQEFAGVAGRELERWRTLLSLLVPFAAGIAIPLAGFLIPYIVSGSVRDLAHGLIATPTRSIQFAALAPEGPINMITIAPFALPVIIGSEFRKVGRAICGTLVVLSAGAILIYSSRSSYLYALGWESMRTAIPVLVLAGIVIVWVSGRQRKMSVMRQQRIVLVLCVAALCSVIQFPFGAAVYFFYAAPLGILAAVAVFTSADHPPRFVLGGLIGFYLLFVVLRVTPGFLHHMGLGYAPDEQTERLTIPRAGGLRVEPRDAELYQTLIPLVQSHAKGKYIYAAPDCPEVYFLTGLGSPTRHYFDYAENPVDHTKKVLNIIERLGVNVVAISEDPQFSGELSQDLQDALEDRYPNSADLGRFEVRWKD